MPDDSQTQLVIVDDDELIIGLVKRILVNENCQVHGFTAQEDGFAHLAHSAPDYLFVDMKMPKMNGVQFITQLFESGFDDTTRVFLCSGALPETKVHTQLSQMGVKIIIKDQVCTKSWLRNTLELDDQLHGMMQQYGT